MSGRDRISELPCVILGEILSHLDMKQVVQTCILSKQWQHLWLSVPSLNFNRSMWMLQQEKNALKILARTIRFIEFVNQVLNSRFRSHDNTIQKFRLSNMDVNDSLLLDKWITSAALLSAEELHLDNICINPIPNPVLGNIRTLRLTSVVLGCDPLSNSISLVLENVENLMIEECFLELQAVNVNRKLVIDAPLLKHLVVKHKRIWFCIRDYQFVIDAPNLNTMVFIGYDMFMDYHFRNMSSLVSADFQVEFPSDVRIEVDVVTNCLKNILRGVSNARCLTLSASAFQVSLELPDLLKRSRNSFVNLKFLKLTQWCQDDHIGAMLLELFPCVEKLILEGSKKRFGGRINIGDWGEQSSFQSQCILSHLKTVEIRNLEEGCEDELKFLEFIMRNATVLEKIIIKETKFVSANTEKKLVEFAKKLQLLSMPYSSVVITLMVKVKRI